MSDLNGIGVALVTPLKKDKVDTKGIKSLLDLVGPYVDYYVVMGTTGESATLTRDEKRIVLSNVLELNNDKPIVYGIGGNNTNSVLEEIESTDLSGVDALLSVSPYYNKPPQAGIIQHFQKIADTCPVPVILYNVPGRTGSNIEASSTITLSEHDNIIGIKEASGDLHQCEAIVEGTDPDFMLISGDDLLTPQILERGGKGVISVLANGVPELFSRFTKSFSSLTSTERDNLLELNDLMYKEGNPVGVKEVLRQRKICGNEVRLPLVPASKELKTNISRILKNLA